MTPGPVGETWAPLRWPASSGPRLARTILFAGIKHIGASRASALAAANVFFAMCLAMVFLGETLTGIVFVASVAIAVGCVFITRSHPDSAEREGRRRVILGTVLSLGSAAAFGASSVFVRPVIRGFTSPVLASFYANTFAILSFLPYGLARPLSGEVKQWSRQTAALLALSGLAATVGTIGNYAALKHAPVLFVQPLLQTRPFFVVAISRFFFQVHEQVNWKVAVGARPGGGRHGSAHQGLTASLKPFACALTFRGPCHKLLSGPTRRHGGGPSGETTLPEHAPRSSLRRRLP